MSQQQQCKIVSVISPNQILILTQNQKTLIVGDGNNTNFLHRNNLILNKSQLECYKHQVQYLDKDAQYLQKNGQLLVSGQDILNKIIDSEEIHLKLIGVQNEQYQNEEQINTVNQYIRQMRNKSIEARFVSFEGNILNFLYEDTLISLIPNAIYIDEFGIQDINYTKLMQREWLGRIFHIEFKGIHTITLINEDKFIHIPILKADLYNINESNTELNNQFYNSLVQNGYAFLTDWGKLNLNQNVFRLLYESQEDSKRNNLGMWKNGELDRRMLNSVSTQKSGKVVEIIEANHYLILTDKELLNIKLDRIFIEGLEAKEFARKILIGKKVHILQVGNTLPHYTIKLVDNNLDIEEELVANGWATAKENHPNLSKFYQQHYQTLSQKAKQRKLGQYNPELTWRVEDQTDQKQGKSVNEIIWMNIQREVESKNTQGITMGITQHHETQFEVLIDKVFGGGVFQITLLNYHSMVNFQLSNIIKLSQFSQSFPAVIQYDNQLKQYSYDLLMQRNAWVKLEEFNLQENIFTGVLYLKKNHKESDFTLNILNEGLAFLNENKNYIASYSNAQKLAQQQNKGFWKESFAQFIVDFEKNKLSLKKQSSGIGTIQKHENQQSETIIVTTVNDCNEFFIRKQDNPEFELLQSKVEKSKLQPLNKPVKKGTLCLAIFSEDGQIYRAQVLQAYKNDKFLVKFIDYGNDDQVNFIDMGILPAELTNIPQQARMCSLAYIRVPPNTHEYTEEATEKLREMILDQQFESKLAYTEKSTNRQYVLLKTPGQLDEIEYTINALALQQGIGRIEDRVLYNPLKEKGAEFQSQAKQKDLGIWGYDDQLEDEKQFQDEYDY